MPQFDASSPEGADRNPPPSQAASTLSMWLVFIGAIFVLALAASSAARMPYLPTRRFAFVCHFVLPSILFVVVHVAAFIRVRGNTFARRFYANLATTKAACQGVPRVVILAGVEVGFAFCAVGMIYLLLEAPLIWFTKYGAHDPVEFVVEVDDTYGDFPSQSPTASRFGSRSKLPITFQDGYQAQLPWPRGQMEKLRAGDKLLLTGRTGPFGTYVDSWRQVKP